MGELSELALLSTAGTVVRARQILTARAIDLDGDDEKRETRSLIYLLNATFVRHDLYLCECTYAAGNESVDPVCHAMKNLAYDIVQRGE